MNNLRRFALKSFKLFCGLYLLGISAIIYDGLHDNIFKADMMVVLGSKINRNGTPGLRVRSRLDRAIELFNQGQTKVILVSGEIEKEGLDEAQVMANYLIQHHIPATAIVRDHLGNNTMATAKNTRILMTQRHFGSVLVVSQYFHISRTKLALRQMGITQIGQAHAHFVSLKDILSLLREGIAYVVYVCGMR